MKHQVKIETLAHSVLRMLDADTWPPKQLLRDSAAGIICNATPVWPHICI
jgi:hypothetical protein